MEKNIKEKTFFNLIWRFAERILAQSVTLLVTIVLARILMPDDYAAGKLSETGMKKLYQKFKHLTRFIPDSARVPLTLW